MQTKKFCIKIDKTFPHRDYTQLKWVANEEHNLDSFEDKHYVYIYSENDSIENLQYYIDYVREWHEVDLIIESNVQVI